MALQQHGNKQRSHDGHYQENGFVCFAWGGRGVVCFFVGVHILDFDMACHNLIK